MKRGTKIALTTGIIVGLFASSMFFIDTNYLFAKDENLNNDSLKMVNSQREKNDLSDLKWNSQLELAASKKANDIFAKNYFDHTSPDGKKAWDFILDSGYSYKIAGENLAVDYTNVNDAFKGWEQSPTHLANILSNEYSDYALVQKSGTLDGKQTIVFVQLFASK